MPADQQGSVYKTSKGYGLRWYDENGVRSRKAGFTSRSEARGWFRDVEFKRMRGEAVARPPVTLRSTSTGSWTCTARPAIRTRCGRLEDV